MKKFLALSLLASFPAFGMEFDDTKRALLLDEIREGYEQRVAQQEAQRAEEAGVRQLMLPQEQSTAGQDGFLNDAMSIRSEDENALALMQLNNEQILLNRKLNQVLKKLDNNWAKRPRVCEIRGSGIAFMMIPIACYYSWWLLSLAL